MNLKKLIEVYSEYPFFYPEQKLRTGVLLLKGINSNYYKDLLTLLSDTDKEAVNLYHQCKGDQNKFRHLFSDFYVICGVTLNIYLILTETLGLEEGFDFEYDDLCNLILPKKYQETFNSIWKIPEIHSQNQTNYGFEVLFE